MKNTIITILIIFIVVISAVSYSRINVLSKENNEIKERIERLTFQGNVNMGPIFAGEMMDNLTKVYDADVYLTSAFYRPNREANSQIGYCISFKGWEKEKVCTTNLNETLDSNYHDYVTRILNEGKISEKLGDLMKKKDLTEEEIIEGLREKW